MDIDLELNKLIEKYNICNSIELINPKINIENFVSKCKKLGKIGIRCAGTVTEDFLACFGDKLEIVAIFDKYPERVNSVLKKYNIPIISSEKITEYDLDVMIISTSDYREEIKKELSESNIPYIFDLYEELDKAYNIRVRGGFNGLLTNPYLYIISLTSIYRKSKDVAEKIGVIQKLICYFLYNRDLVSVKLWIEEYIKNNYPDKEKYILFWEEIKKLMLEVRNKLSTRNKKDVLILWQDSLNYEHVKYMPFENKCRKKGMYLKNARGVVVWTRATFKAVLDKHLPIDNYGEIVSDNGHKLTELFMNNGYDCKYMGEHKCLDLHTYDLEKYINKFQDFEPISMLYWRVLKLLLESEKPVMAIVQSIYETHLPNCTPNLVSYEPRQATDTIKKSEYNAWKKQAMSAVKYVDSQTKHLFSLLDKTTIKILMSDHGKVLRSNSRGWDNDALNVNCIVIGEGIKSQTCEKMFSLANFYELAEYILNPNEENYNNIFLEEIPFQNLDMYNLRKIYDLIDNGIEERGIAFRGFQSLYDRYVLLRTGKEIYNRLPDEKTNYIDDERFKERIQYLREKTGTKFADRNGDNILLYDSLRRKGRL